MKKRFGSVYNFFRMFKMDQGAYFTHNLGVGMLRLAALLFIVSFAFIIVYLFFGGVRVRFTETVSAQVINLADNTYYYRIDPETHEVRPMTLEEYNEEYYSVTAPWKNLREENTYVVTFSGKRKNGSKFEISQQVTRFRFREYFDEINQPASLYDMYRVNVSKDPYLVPHGYTKNQALYQYCDSHVGADPPISLWGMWIPLLLSLVLFLMGKKQINIALKYPRNDVPVEISGAPEAVIDKEKEHDRYRRIAERMYRQQMGTYMNRLPESSDESE